jgi:branched-chain amino acid transport system substrate-binding protein
LEIDKVDLVISAYATNQIAPAMPIVMQRNMVFMALFGTGVNDKFHYDKYFQILPNGKETRFGPSQGFLETALTMAPKPETIAIVGADAEYAQTVLAGAREKIKEIGLKIVYDRSYPPNTVDFIPIVRAIQATNADLVVICSYPPDSVGMVLAINEVGFKPKMVGGAMVGLQSTAIKTKLGPMLNGFVTYDFWLPVPKMQFPGVAELMQKYQARAAAEGVDALGYYMAPQAYAQMQVLQQAIEATKSLNDQKIADYIRANTFKTVLGDVKFGAGGEWAQSRVLQVQFQNIKGNDVAQFKDISSQVVLTPTEYASGKVIYPFEKAR